MSGIFVIGGGAAGLAAAISAARQGAAVTVLESGRRSAGKILATGGGRCNFTNMNMSPDSFYDCPEVFSSAFLSAFPPVAALDFFYSMGVIPVIRDGYAYPRSEEAASIRNALLRECERLRVTVRNNTPAESIKASGGFDIVSGGYTYHADKVILAAGGKASPVFGSNGSGYALARSLGHDITQLSPGLSGLVCGEALKPAAGVRVYAALKLFDGEKQLMGTKGEIQINEDSISGIPAMCLGRIAGRSGRPLTLEIDFAPALTREELSEAASCGSLDGVFPSKLASLLAADPDPAGAAKSMRVEIKGTTGFENAHVTSGGVALSGIDPYTMESKLVKGLYFAGEIMDVDGLCGGYNLHFAWASGVMAGFSAATGGRYLYGGTDEAHSALFKKCMTGSRRS